MEPNPNNLFTETQKINSPIVRHTVITLSAFFVLGLSCLLVAQSDSALFVFGFGFFSASCIMLIIDIYLFLASSFIKINEQGIFIDARYQKTKILCKWDNIDQMFVRDRFFWIRSSFKNGICYNVKAQNGIQIIFKNGKKLQVGIENVEEAQPVIERYLKTKMPRYQN